MRHMTQQPPRDSSTLEPFQVVNYPQPEDEIDLVDLWRLVMKKKQLVIFGLLLGWLLAGGWLLFAKPAYKAESRLLPPSHQILAELTVISGEYDPLSVFKRFNNNFISINNKRRFFDENNLLAHFSKEKASPDEQNHFFTRLFNDKLTLDFDSKQDIPEVSTAHFQLDDAVLSAKWLNQYVDYIQEVTLDEIFAEVDEELAIDKRTLKNKIKIKIASGEQLRRDEIARLDEALEIARQLGLKSSHSFLVNTEKEQASVEVNTQDQPLYTRGMEALGAELVALKARQHEEPFITGLRPLEEKLAQLEMLKPNKSKTRTVIVDQRAVSAESASNKKLPLILTLSSIVGLLAGLFIVFLQRFSQRVRDVESNQDIEAR